MGYFGRVGGGLVTLVVIKQAKAPPEVRKVVAHKSEMYHSHVRELVGKGKGEKALRLMSRTTILL